MHIQESRSLRESQLLASECGERRHCVFHQLNPQRVSQPESSSDGIIFRSGKTKHLSVVSTSFSALHESIGGKS